MKQIRLNKLTLRNFKGIENFTLELNGESATVYGDNATGKTTLFDAFTWVLFDKDSHNKSQFEIKTLDENNEPIHGLEHEVEANFDVDGKQITLRKVYAEKWTKKRGAAKAEFTGHKTEYFVNSVPVKKKEYADQVAEIVDEETFKLLTNPTYFNEVLNWKERREILLEICGDISDSEVIASKDDLAGLHDVLQGRSIEEHRRIITARRSEINKELDKIPVRIDEVKRGMPELRPEGKEFFDRKIDEIKSRISDKEAEIQRIRSGGEIPNLEKKIREIEAEIMQVQNEHSKVFYDKLQEKTKQLNDIKYHMASLDYEITRCDRVIESNQEQIKDLESEMQKLREKWTAVNNREMIYDLETSCPTCGQNLPEEQIQSAKDKALELFNIEKSTELEQITKKGQSMKKQVEELKAQVQKAQNDKTRFVEAIEKKQQELEVVEQEIENLNKSIADMGENPIVTAKEKEIEKLKQEIATLRISVDESVQKVMQEIEFLRSELAGFEEYSSQYDRAKHAEKRIKELIEQERQLAAEFERLEHELYMTEEFIRTKVNMLEDRINSKFKLAKFKLFDVQVNGALNEVCETTYNGVPYSTGLNNAMKINVGLDIINTLSEHFGFSAPIFIDNAEAVTKLIETNAQVIKLVVSEKDKQLRIETHGVTNEEVT